MDGKTDNELRDVHLTVLGSSHPRYTRQHEQQSMQVAARPDWYAHVSQFSGGG
jgi:hypothetical protein